MPDVTLHFEATDTAFRLTVEPWACPEFEVLPSERCIVIVHHPTALAFVTTTVVRGQVYVNVYDAGSTFTFVRNGVVEFTIPGHLSIPQLSGGHTGVA